MRHKFPEHRGIPGSTSVMWKSHWDFNESLIPIWVRVPDWIHRNRNTQIVSNLAIDSLNLFLCVIFISFHYSFIHPFIYLHWVYPMGRTQWYRHWRNTNAKVRKQLSSRVIRKHDKSYKNKKLWELCNWTRGGLDLALGIAEDVSEEVLILLRLQGWKETG